MNLKKSLLLAVVFCVALSCSVFAQTITIEGKFKVTVDHAQTIEQMVAAGDYDWGTIGLISPNFPEIRPSKRGKKEITIEIVRFDEFIESSKFVLERLNREGLRPATFRELMSFGATYQAEQRKYTIVALGFVWESWNGNKYIFGLGGNSSERSLLNFLHCGGWKPNYRFAAVRK